MQKKSKIKKEKWLRPILTVLTKGEDRSERILEGCKLAGLGGEGSQNAYSICALTEEACYGLCSGYSES